MTIRLIIADDHNIVRKGIRSLLEGQSHIEVVGEAETGAQCLELIAQHEPDVVLMDISMPDGDGIATTKRIVEAWPRVQILGLTMHEDGQYVLSLIRAGAAGYVVKGADPEELLVAIETVARGEVYIQPSVAGHVVAGVRAPQPDKHHAGGALTEREREVLTLIAEGLTGREIAQRLVISIHTVDRHRTNMMNKLGTRNKVELIKYAIRAGLVNPDA